MYVKYAFLESAHSRMQRNTPKSLSAATTLVIGSVLRLCVFPSYVNSLAISFKILTFNFNAFSYYMMCCRIGKYNSIVGFTLYYAAAFSLFFIEEMSLKMITVRATPITAEMM